MPWIKSSISFLSITPQHSIKLAFFITTTRAKLLIFPREPLNMEKGWSNLKLTNDSTKDGDGFRLVKDTFCKVFWTDNALILLRRRKTLDLRLCSGTKLELQNSSGDQCLLELGFGKSNLAMLLGNIWPLKTIQLTMEANCKLTTITDLLKFGESKDSFQNDL